MPKSSDIYEVYAVEYGHNVRSSRFNYIFPDPHDGPCLITYYVWVIQNQDRIIVVDIGFGHEAAAARGRELLRHPVDGLAAIGVDAAKVETVILTHMHFDHAGTTSSFPKARFVVQEKEMHFATGRDMRHAPCRMPFDVDNVTDLVRANFKERVHFVDGDQEIAPGVSVHLVGGHSRGLQMVRIQTPVGPLVLASDATHLYDNIVLKNPFPIVADLGQMCAGYERMFQLGASSDRVIPGHDPRVKEFYPKHRDDELTVHLSGELLAVPPFAQHADELLR